MKNQSKNPLKRKTQSCRDDLSPAGRKALKTKILFLGFLLSTQAYACLCSGEISSAFSSMESNVIDENMKKIPVPIDKLTEEKNRQNGVTLEENNKLEEMIHTQRIQTLSLENLAFLLKEQNNQLSQYGNPPPFKPTKLDPNKTYNKPTAPTIAPPPAYISGFALKLSPASDTGHYDWDSITKDTNPIFVTSLDSQYKSGDTINITIDDTNTITHTITTSEISQGKSEIPLTLIDEKKYNISAIVTRDSQEVSSNVYTYITIDTTVPQAVEFTTTDTKIGIGDESTLTFKFNEDMAPVHSHLQAKYGTPVGITDNPEYDASIYQFTFVPDSNIQVYPQENYFYFDGATDLAGNPLSKTHKTQSYIVDTVAPYIESNTCGSITFNEPVYYQESDTASTTIYKSNPSDKDGNCYAHVSIGDITDQGGNTNSTSINPD